jgi:uncharacterized C2H2 Zn-finger protein
MLMIRCPNTGKLFSTGMDMDRSIFQNATFTGNSVKCPHCAQVHAWSKGDVIFSDDDKTDQNDRA